MSRDSRFINHGATVEPRHVSSTIALKRLQRFLHDNTAVVPVLVLNASVVGFALIAGERFFTAFNLTLVIQQIAIVGLLGCAQTLIILTAGIDLSVAAIMVLSAVVMGKLDVDSGLPGPIAIAAGVGAATACGLMNGLLVTRLRLPPFIVSLGTWNVFFALLILYSGSQSVRGQDIDRTAPLLKLFG